MTNSIRWLLEKNINAKESPAEAVRFMVSRLGGRTDWTAAEKKQVYRAAYKIQKERNNNET